MNHTSDILQEEHEVVARVLELLKAAADRLETGEELPAELFLQFVDFIRNFGDRCHHAKEEEIFFKLMEKRGFSLQDGPLSVMLLEHEEGRKFTRAMEAGALSWQKGNHSAKTEVISNARGFVDLLTQHIFKENNILYPMANRVFTPDDQKYLAAEFERREREVVGAGVHEKYHHLVHELEEHLGMDHAAKNH